MIATIEMIQQNILYNDKSSCRNNSFADVFGVGTMFESVCLFVCLFICLFVRNITHKRMIKVFKLGIGMTLKYPRSGTVLEFKVTRSLSSFRILEPCVLELRFIDIHYVCGFSDA